MVVGADVETIGLDAEVCEMGVDTGFIKLLGVSDLVGDLCDTYVTCLSHT